MKDCASERSFSSFVSSINSLGYYILYPSTSLSKDSFGQINWLLAIPHGRCLISLSFGIDQVVIKKNCSGDDKQSALSLYISHVLLPAALLRNITWRASLCFRIMRYL